MFRIIDGHFETISLVPHQPNILLTSLLLLLDAAETIRICLQKIETIDLATTKEAITTVCVSFPVALDWMYVVLFPRFMSILCIYIIFSNVPML